MWSATASIVGSLPCRCRRGYSIRNGMILQINRLKKKRKLNTLPACSRTSIASLGRRAATRATETGDGALQVLARIGAHTQGFAGTRL